jgi:hypothetical protein
MLPAGAALTGCTTLSQAKDPIHVPGIRAKEYRKRISERRQTTWASVSNKSDDEVHMKLSLP